MAAVGLIAGWLVVWRVGILLVRHFESSGPHTDARTSPERRYWSKVGQDPSLSISSSETPADRCEVGR